MSKGADYPKSLDIIKEAIKKEKNVANFPNSERAMWLDYMPSPPKIYGKKKAEVVYFVGCMASFSPQIQDIPAAFAQILEKAGVDFLILGEKEWCCGYPLMGAGMSKEAEELIKHNTKVIEKTGAKMVVFSCPSCYKTFKEHYSINAALLHHTQFIELLIREGKIKLGEIEKKLTYHDPCDLGRHSGVYEEPRQVIKSIPKAEFVELEKNREFATCCGGGGDLELVKPELTTRISLEVVEEAKEVEAQTIVTACQQCKRVIKKGVAESKEKLEVVDIAEIVLDAMEE